MHVRLVRHLLEEHAAHEVRNAHVEFQNGLAGGLEVAPTHGQRGPIHTEVDVLRRVRNGCEIITKASKQILDGFRVTGMLNREYVS